MELVEIKTPEETPKRFSRKGSMPLSIRFTLDEIHFIKEESEKEGIKQTKFIRNLLDKALDKNQEQDSEKVEKLENAINDLLDFYSDLAKRGILSDEDKDRLNKIQEEL